MGSWHIFDYDAEPCVLFIANYMHLNITIILLFYNKKNEQIDKTLILRYYSIFFRSGKLVPGLVKIVSLPDRLSCKVLRTFVKTVILLVNGLFKYHPGDQGASVEDENNIF